MCSPSSLISLGIAIFIAAAIGVLVVWGEARAQSRAWRNAPEEYGAEEGADR